jgi:hypothetical protein
VGLVLNGPVFDGHAMMVTNWQAVAERHHFVGSAKVAWTAMT